MRTIISICQRCAPGLRSLPLLSSSLFPLFSGVAAVCDTTPWNPLLSSFGGELGNVLPGVERARCFILQYLCFVLQYLCLVLKDLFCTAVFVLYCSIYCFVLRYLYSSISALYCSICCGVVVLYCSICISVSLLCTAVALSVLLLYCRVVRRY